MFSSLFTQHEIGKRINLYDSTSKKMSQMLYICHICQPGPTRFQDLDTIITTALQCLLLMLQIFLYQNLVELIVFIIYFVIIVIIINILFLFLLFLLLLSSSFLLLLLLVFTLIYHMGKVLTLSVGFWTLRITNKSQVIL